MFKIIDTDSNELNVLLLFFQYFLWMRLIDQVARGVAPDRDYKILLTRLRYFYFGGVELYTHSSNSYDYLIRWAYLIYGHRWHSYGAAYNLTAAYRTAYLHRPQGYAEWMHESGYKTISKVLGEDLSYEELTLQGWVSFDEYFTLQEKQSRRNSYRFQGGPP